MKDFIKSFVIPPYWKYNEEEITRITYDGNAYQLLDMPCSCPIAFKLSSQDDSKWWQFPLEPIVAISGKNNIVKRNVLKVLDSDTERRGSVKELWSQDDYEINIAGTFKTNNNTLPESEIRKLRTFCEARETIDVKASLFVFFGITKIAIEDFQFPFTRGLENQMFSIKAYSDDFSIEQLLILE